MTIESAGHDTAGAAGLHAAALAAAREAYCPYSGLGVGAAARADGGRSGARVVTGCNVENASFGLTLCAECAVVSGLVLGGGGRLLEIAVVSASGARLAPCGRCRQLLHEHGGADLLVHLDRGPVPLGELLPDAFGPADLP